MSGKVHCKHRGADATLCTEERNNASYAALCVRIHCHARVKPLERRCEFGGIDRLGQKLGATVAHGAQQDSCVELRTDPDDADLFEEDLVKAFRRLKRQFRVPVEVNQRDARGRVLE
jgi:hypothetical protein